MLTGNVIQEALAYAEEVFRNDSSGHDYAHTCRVFRMASRIAAEENADMNIVCLAALLHDVDDRKLFPETYLTKKNARGFLTEHQVSKQETETILQIIEEVSFAGRDSVVPAILEGRCVQDADRLDAIGAIGGGRAFAYGGAHGRKMHDPEELPVYDMDRETYFRHESTTVNHFYEKLLLLKDSMSTAAGRKIAEHRDSVMRAFLDEFLSEWAGER